MALAHRFGRRFVLWLVAGALVAGGCRGTPSPTAVDSAIPRRGRAVFEDQTSVRSESFRVYQSDLPRDLCVTMRLRVGRVEWQLLGPDGRNASGSGDATTSQAYHVSYCIVLAPGEWELVLELDAASGEYETAWYAPGEAPSVATRLSVTGD